MNRQSLLGHLLVSKLSSQAENLATESLLYIIESSPVAKQSLLRFLKEICPDYSLGEVNFRSQQLCEGGCIPDLVGTDSEFKKRIIIEAKFWANLTANQPVAYLEQLDPHGLLIFIAPALRLASLSAELVRRCREANLSISPEILVGREVVFRKISSHHTLVLASWRAVLNHLVSRLTLEEDQRTLADVLQLLGLCERVDQEAFLPLRSEELGGNLARRILQFHRIIDDVAQKLLEEGVASPLPSRKTSESGGTYWRPMKINGCNCYLQVNLSLWSNAQRLTPIWLRVADERDLVSLAIKEALGPLEREDPSPIIYDEGRLEVALFMPLGEERPAVVKSIFLQVSRVAKLLSSIPIADSVESTSSNFELPSAQAS